MAEIVNLRQARKRRDRETADLLAEENRARYGLTKPEKARAGSERAKILAALDGARLDRRNRDDGEPST